MSPRDARALAFGSLAEAYERGRPEWPVDLLDAVPVPAGSFVLDLAGGTGKLTRLLATRHRVVAVEPDHAMRTLIAEAEALPGTAEQIPLPDAAVDAVFVGEAFHWFEGPRAVAEIARRAPPGRRARDRLPVQRWEIEPAVPAEVERVLEAAVERFGPPGGP